MAGGFMSEAETGFTGWKFYFNSYTRRGRFNCVASIYGGILGIILFRKLTKKAPPPAIEAK